MKQCCLVVLFISVYIYVNFQLDCGVRGQGLSHVVPLGTSADPLGQVIAGALPHRL